MEENVSGCFFSEHSVYLCHDLDLSVTWRHQTRDHSNPNMPFLISNAGFRDIVPETSCAHDAQLCLLPIRIDAVLHWALMNFIPPTLW